MPYATNPVDGVRTYFEDAEGASPPVLFYTGFADPLLLLATHALLDPSGHFWETGRVATEGPGSHRSREMLSKACVVLGDLGACAFDRLRDAHSRALGVRRGPAVMVAQADGPCQLVREEVNLRGGLGSALGVAPAVCLIELLAQVGEPLAVGALGLGIEELAGVTESEAARGW